MLLDRRVLSGLLLSVIGCSRGHSPTRAEVCDATTSPDLIEIFNFGPNPGNLSMFLFEPPGLPGAAPVVLVLHGCLSSVAEFERSGWNGLAAANRFRVIYAETTQDSGCFRFDDPAQTTRGAGEAESLAEMVEFLQSEGRVAPGEVFVAGFSAGGGMAAALAAAYPDLFTAAAIDATIPVACVGSNSSLDDCLAGDVERTPAQWGDSVRSADPGYGGVRPRISLWQGGADPIVAPVNQDDLVAQWANVLGIDTAAGLATSVNGIDHVSYPDGSGNPLLEIWNDPTLEHAVDVDPDEDCGISVDEFVSSRVCASQTAAAFFGIGSAIPTPTKTPVPTPTPTSTLTPSPSPTASASPSVTESAAPTPAESSTATPIETPACDH